MAFIMKKFSDLGKFSLIYGNFYLLFTYLVMV